MVRRNVGELVKKEGPWITTILNEFTLIWNMWLIQKYHNLKRGGDKLSSKGFKDWHKGMRETVDHIKYAASISYVQCLTWSDGKCVVYYKF